MKFCMVSTFYPPFSFGGDAMHVYRLSNELARRGHSVDVFFCEDAFLLMNGGPPTYECPNHERVRLRPLKSRVGMLSPLATQQTGLPLFKRELKVALEVEGYDVIHYNNMSLIGIKALSYGSAIKLYTTHEHWLVCPMHVLWKFNREVCKERSCFRCQIKGKRPPQIWRKTGLVERMVKHVDCFLSPSRFTLQKHLELGLDVPIRQMPYFLPKPAETVKPPPSETQRSPYFLFVGRLEYIKGVHKLIEAFRERPELELLVAGDGEYRTQLEKQAEGLRNVRFLGRLDQNTLADLYRNATAVLVPSICFETFGIIIIEAFSHRTPVIVHDLGALSEVVEDSCGGYIYRSDGELISALDRLSSDRELRNQLGENGHRAFLNYWNEESHLKRYLGLIETIKERRARGLRPIPIGRSVAAMSQ